MSAVAPRPDYAFLCACLDSFLPVSTALVAGVLRLADQDVSHPIWALTIWADASVTRLFSGGAPHGETARALILSKITCMVSALHWLLELPRGWKNSKVVSVFCAHTIAKRFVVPHALIGSSGVKVDLWGNPITATNKAAADACNVPKRRITAGASVLIAGRIGIVAARRPIVGSIGVRMIICSCPTAAAAPA